MTLPKKLAELEAMAKANAASPCYTLQAAFAAKRFTEDCDAGMFLALIQTIRDLSGALEGHLRVKNVLNGYENAIEKSPGKSLPMDETGASAFRRLDEMAEALADYRAKWEG